MRFIFLAIKDVLLSYTPSRSLIEAMMKYDFKLQEVRPSLMQLCFSNLASWPLVAVLLLVYVDPFKSTWSLVPLLSHENSLVLFLLDGRLGAMFAVFFIFYFLEWIFRKEYLFIGLIFYFLNRSEMHVNLAFASLLAIYLSRISYMWWLGIDCESETSRIWNRAHFLQLISWFLTAFPSLYALDFLQKNFMFNEGGGFTRFGFLAAVIAGYHILSHVLLSLWGHFYFRSQRDPSDLPTYYSTSVWILRFNMSYYLQKLLTEKITPQIEKHEEHIKQYDELKAYNAAIGKMPIPDVLRKEIINLKEANLRLTKI